MDRDGHLELSDSAIEAAARRMVAALQERHRGYRMPPFDKLPNEQRNAWLLDARAALVGVGYAETLADMREALDAIDNYAAQDCGHELHAIVEHYRSALGL